MKERNREDKRAEQNTRPYDDYFMLEKSLYDRFYQLIFRFKTLQVAAI